MNQWQISANPPLRCNEGFQLLTGKAEFVRITHEGYGLFLLINPDGRQFHRQFIAEFCKTRIVDFVHFRDGHTQHSTLLGRIATCPIPTICCGHAEILAGAICIPGGIAVIIKAFNFQDIPHVQTASPCMQNRSARNICLGTQEQICLGNVGADTASFRQHPIGRGF